MKSLQGQLLVATPGLLDPHFFHSVLLIVQHDENGAMGVILNRPSRMMLSAAWKQVSDSPCLIEANLFQGGPCEGPLIVLHGEQEKSQLEVMPGVYFSTEAGNISWLVENVSHPTKFMVGYAGWGPGQLESEIGHAAWQIAATSTEQIFETPEDQWEMLTKILARASRFPHVNPNLIPPDPSMN